MYLQLTTRCNMACAHCCFSATNKGEDMAWDTFVRAVECSRGDFITLGGGEPTVHPKFNEMLDYVLERANEGYFEGPVLVITNGKLVTKARRLLGLAESEMYPLQVELSQDEYHDPIRQEILTRFQAGQRMRQQRFNRWTATPGDGRGYGIRSVTQILPIGRGAELDEHNGEDTCCCDTPLVAPDGTVFTCGCKLEVAGNVMEPWTLSAFEGNWGHPEKEEWLEAA